MLPFLPTKVTIITSAMSRTIILGIILLAACTAVAMWHPSAAPPAKPRAALPSKPRTAPPAKLRAAPAAEPLVCSAVAVVGPSGAMPEDLLPTLVSSGDLAVDIGANVGQTAQLLAGAGARVLSFEPSPETCASFLSNTASLRGVDLVCAAVGQEPGVVTFLDSPSGSTSFMQLPEGRHRGNLSRGGAAASQTSTAATDAGPKMRTIPVVTLDAVLAARGWHDLRVLKTDTQGREWAALHGATATLASVPHVIMEFSYGLLAAAGTDQAALVRWLAGHGLSCHYMDKRVPGGKMEWPESMGKCVTPDQLVAAVKGGWTNLWCRRGEDGNRSDNGERGGGDANGGDSSAATAVLGRRGGAGGDA